MKHNSLAPLLGGAVVVIFCAGCMSTKPEPAATVSGIDQVVPPEGSITVPPSPPLPEVEYSDDIRPATQTYVVRPGDSLSRVAARFGITVEEIVALNAISNPNRIRVGQGLDLPAGARERSAPPQSKRVRAVSGDSYVIQPGDSLSKIAAAYKVSVAALKQANGLQSDTIRAGARLVIPKTTVAVKAAPKGAAGEPAVDMTNPDPTDSPAPRNVEAPQDM